MPPSPTKPRNSTPWREDSQAIFGRDDPKTSWQMSSMPGDVEMCEVDGDDDRDGFDEDAKAGLQELQRRGRGSKRPIKEVHVSAPHLDRARDLYLDSLERNPWSGVNGASFVPANQTLIPPKDEAGNVGEDDFDLPSPVEIAMVGYLRGERNYQRKWDVSLKYSEFVSYVGKNARDFIPQLWMTHANEANVAIRPNSVVVSGHSEVWLDTLCGLQIHDAADPKVAALNADHMLSQYDYSSLDKSYHITMAKRPGALGVAFEYLAAWGLELQSQVVRLYTARLLDGEFLSNNLSWSALIDQIATTPTIFQMMWNARNHIKMLTDPLPSDYVFMAAREEDNTVTGVNLLLIMKDEIVKIMDRYAYLFVSSTAEGQEYLRTIRGHSAQELGYAWITARLGRQLETVEKVMSVVLWKSRYRSNETPEWKLLGQFLQSANALERLWQVREAIQPTGKMPDKLVLVFRREVTIFSGLVLLTESEFEKWTTSKTTGVVHLERDANGKYQSTSYKGTGAKEVVESLVSGNSVETDVTLNDVTSLFGMAITGGWESLDKIAAAAGRSTEAHVARGGLVFFLGDKISDVLMTGKLPSLNLKETVSDYGALTVGNALGEIASTKMGIPVTSFVGQSIALLAALTTAEFVRTGHVNWKQLPQTAGNVTVAGGMTAVLAPVLRINLFSFWGQAAAAVMNFTFFKELSKIEINYADAKDFNTILETVTEVLLADQAQLTQLAKGQPVSMGMLEATDRWLIDNEKQLRKRSNATAILIGLDYAQKLETLRDNHQTRMRFGIYAWIYPERVTQQYNDAKMQIEVERDAALKKAHGEEDRSFTPLAVDPAQSALQRLDQVDEDQLKADVDIDGNPQHPESVMQFQALLAHNGQALADQLARYRQDRQAFISRFLQN